MLKSHCLPRALAAVLCAAAHTALAATAATYPTKPIRIIVPFAPGGGTDLVARAIAVRYTETWGQPVVVDNRAGGNGNIGTEIVAKAPADGYTLLFNTNATLVINPHMSKLGYDPVRDFAPITQAAALPFVLLLHPSVPAKSVSDLVALIKAKPGEFNYGSSGNGGGAHLAGELLKSTAKLEMTHIPYKGAAPALVALIGGEVKFMFVSILPATPLIESGKVRVIGVASKKRSPSLPNVPAIAETPGLTSFESDLWYGLLAPAKTPAAIVNKLYQETRRILSLPEIRNRFEPSGTVFVGSSPAEFANLIKN
ncbi:MAG TPA: tripartite tricarboxylate transporter substrate binding protein, partial [Burkholderiales bacterium]|nr:tripartite tricarboxylate transporter substrate binding protein [Burkholderiales bacterium]